MTTPFSTASLCSCDFTLNFHLNLCKAQGASFHSVAGFLMLEVPHLQTVTIVGNTLGKVPRTAVIDLLLIPAAGLKAVGNAEAVPPMAALGAGSSLMK